MMFTDFQAGNKDYQLRLNTRAIVALEKTIGCNPLAIFGAGDTIPTITTMVAILHASLQQYHHGITMANAYDIFDDYLADGHSMTDFIPVILDVYRECGLIRDNKDVEEKN